MFRNSRWTSTLLTVLALIAFLVSPASATVKQKLKGKLADIYGVPVQSMTRIEPIDDTDPGMPFILVPAISLQQPVCRVGGACYLATLAVCPMTILLEQPGGPTYNCELDCHGSQPDMNDQCDCDVKLDTCKPA